jgi:hypothetical protein
MASPPNKNSASGRTLRACKVVEPAETGHPETSKEFAARVKKNFILKGPCE